MSGEAQYVVEVRGGFYRRGLHGRRETTNSRGLATVFVNYEAAKQIAAEVGGLVVRADLQRDLF